MSHPLSHVPDGPKDPWSVDFVSRPSQDADARAVTNNGAAPRAAAFDAVIGPSPSRGVKVGSRGPEELMGAAHDELSQRDQPLVGDLLLSSMSESTFHAHSQQQPQHQEPGCSVSAGGQLPAREFSTNITASSAGAAGPPLQIPPGALVDFLASSQLSTTVAPPMAMPGGYASHGASANTSFQHQLSGPSAGHSGAAAASSSMPIFSSFATTSSHQAAPYILTAEGSEGPRRHAGVAGPMGSAGSSTSSSGGGIRRMATGRSIVVSGLPPDFDFFKLKQLFSGFGKIVSARALTHPDSTLCTGVGYVNFESSDDARRAQRDMNGATVVANGSDGITAPPFTMQVKAADEDLTYVSEETTKIFIRHIPRDTTPEELSATFRHFGNVIQAVVKDDTSSKGRQEQTNLKMGYVTFERVEEALAASRDANGKLFLRSSTIPLIVKLAETLACRSQRQNRVSPAVSTSSASPHTTPSPSNSPPHLTGTAHPTPQAHSLPGSWAAPPPAGAPHFGLSPMQAGGMYIVDPASLNFAVAPQGAISWQPPPTTNRFNPPSATAGHNPPSPQRLVMLPQQPQPPLMVQPSNPQFAPLLFSPNDHSHMYAGRQGPVAMPVMAGRDGSYHMITVPASQGFQFMGPQLLQQTAFAGGAQYFVPAPFQGGGGAPRDPIRPTGTDERRF